MTTLREAAQMALDAKSPEEWYVVKKAIRAALATEQAPTNNGRYLTGYKAQPEQEPSEEVLERMVEAYTKYQSPVDRGYAQQEEGMRLALIAGGYTAPQREWQSLTDEEIERLFVWQEWSEDFADYEPVARAIEAKLREKNT